MEKVAAINYIPQRPPMVMVDYILHCDTVATQTQTLIREDNRFVEDGKLLMCGLLEMIAQTCAARIGYLGAGKPVKIGVIGGVRDFEVFDVPSVGDIVTTEIDMTSEVFSAVLADAKVTCKGKELAKCSMKVFVIDNE